MKQNIVVEQLKDVETEDTHSFVWGRFTFRKVEHERTFFETVFGMKIKALYTDQSRRPSKTELRWGCAKFIFFMDNGNIVEMGSSEWASINLNYKPPT